MQLDVLRTAMSLLRYSDHMNEQILSAASTLGDEQLDRTFDMGRSTLRKTLMHLWAGEATWLKRWKGQRETPWPNEEEAAPVEAIRERLHRVFLERDEFLSGLSENELAQTLVYRDSKGGQFSATLSDMLLQGILHSVHHRAQAVNMIRRLSGTSLEMDYMMFIRRPADR